MNTVPNLDDPVEFKKAQAEVLEVLIKLPVMAPLALAYVGLQGYAAFLAPLAMDWHWNQALASQEILACVGLATAASVGFAAIGNLEKADLKNLGVMAKNLGKHIVDGISATGKALGIIDEKDSPLPKAIEPTEQRRSYWASTAVDSLRLAVAAPAIASTFFAVCMTPMAVIDFPRMALPALAVAAVSASTIYAYRKLDQLSGVVNPNGAFSPIEPDGTFTEAVRVAQKEDQEKLSATESVKGRAQRKPAGPLELL